MTDSYICHTCGVEHDTIPQAMACFKTHLPDELQEEVESWRTPDAPELLGRAAHHMHDRAATYDAPSGERSMNKTVAAFNAITGHSLKESEGWLFMAILKSVRAFTREQYHPDSFEDWIAYAALCAEARSKGL